MANNQFAWDILSSPNSNLASTFSNLRSPSNFQFGTGYGGDNIPDDFAFENVGKQNSLQFGVDAGFGGDNIPDDSAFMATQAQLQPPTLPTLGTMDTSIATMNAPAMTSTDFNFDLTPTDMETNTFMTNNATVQDPQTAAAMDTSMGMGDWLNFGLGAANALTGAYFANEEIDLGKDQLALSREDLDFSKQQYQDRLDAASSRSA